MAMACSAIAQGQTSTASSAAATETPPPRITASDFAKSGGLSGLRLSPDGKLIALFAQAKGKRSVAIIDADSRQAVANFSIPPKNEVAWYRWAGPRRLLLSLSSVVPYFDIDAQSTRLLVYDLDTRKLNFISRPEMGLEGDDLLYTDPAGQFVLLAIQKTIYDYPSVWRFPLDETAPRAAKQILAPQHDIWEWYADDAGVVRMGLAFSDKITNVWYRKTGEQTFLSIGKLTKNGGDDEIWNVLRIVSGTDEGYAVKPDDSGRMALRKFNYATRTAGETVFAVPGWDVTDYDVGKDNKPVAAWYTDDRDQVHWFDPAMAALQAKFNRAMKGEDVLITSRAKDDSRMIVWSSHEDDPGAYYLYSAATRQLNMLSEEHPAIDPKQLATPRPITYTARDMTVIHGYLTLPRGRPAKNLPLIVLPHGGPYWVRDKLQYDGDVQFLANRGYAVIQPNYRGSDGYGADFDKLGEGQIGRAMQDDLDDAMDWAVARGIADPKRVCVVGSSYGGYAALWAVIRNPERYRCAVSFAGVVDWKKQLKYSSRSLESGAKRTWKARVTGSQAGFDLDQVSVLANIGKLTRPVLLTHGDEDTRVPFKQFTALRDAAAKAGKQVETLVFNGEGHGFAQSESEQKWYEAMDAFLAKNNPAD
ncbi:MAG: S9 family peptidase [Sphingomonadales bacterium]|nr:S9 family peptidase [Sphingomonadales bacterium]